MEEAPSQPSFLMYSTHMYALWVLTISGASLTAARLTFCPWPAHAAHAASRYQLLRSLAECFVLCKYNKIPEPVWGCKERSLAVVWISRGKVSYLTWQRPPAVPQQGRKTLHSGHKWQEQEEKVTWQEKKQSREGPGLLFDSYWHL